MELKNSNVVFIPDGHRYLYGNLDLQGITSTLIPAIFGDYTKDIPQDVLERAAQRGTQIHEEIARIDEGYSFAVSHEETEYVRLRDSLGLQHIRSEYIVSDYKHFASPIDKVYEGDIIADIKTTAEVHYEQACFQLSWYAYHYKRMNKRPVLKAYILWLPKEQYGKCQAIEVALAPDYVITQVVNSYLKHLDVTRFAHFFTPKLPVPARKVITKIKARKAQLARMEAEVRDMEQVLKDAFELMGVKKFENEEIRITRIDATTRTTLDTKAVQAKYPEVYAECKRESVIGASVRISVKE